MPTTKTTTVLFNDVTLTAGAADTVSSVLDLTDGYGASLSVKLTNGATGPTNPAQVQVEVSNDQTNWYKLGPPLIGNTDNNGVMSVGDVLIPAGTQYLRLVAGSNTDQDVVVRAEVSELSAL